MIVSRRSMAAVALALTLGGLNVFRPGAVLAQDYPTRPVKIIVPFGAGGPADVFSRVLAQHLSDALKEPFIVEDRPGAGSIIGTDTVAKSPPDGYTLLAMSNTHTTNESLIPNKPFQLMRDFTPVAAVNYSDLVMVVHPAVAAKDLRELIALAKSTPGALNYASPGTGTPTVIVDRLNAEINKAIERPEVKAAWDQQGAVPLTMSPSEFDAYLRKDIEKWAGVVKSAGIKPE